MTEKVFTLRIEESLFEKIKLAAEKNKRSIAKEIEWVLEQAIEHPEEQQVLEYLGKVLKSQGKNTLTMTTNVENCDIIPNNDIYL